MAKVDVEPFLTWEQDLPQRAQRRRTPNQPPGTRVELLSTPKKESGTMDVIKEKLYEYVPTYGNYGGPRYTGGQLDGNDYTVVPIDETDATFRDHDKCYEGGKTSECDKKLIADLREVVPDSFSELAYNKAAEAYFTTKDRLRTMTGTHDNETSDSVEPVAIVEEIPHAPRQARRRAQRRATKLEQRFVKQLGREKQIKRQVEADKNNKVTHATNGNMTRHKNKNKKTVVATTVVRTAPNKKMTKNAKKKKNRRVNRTLRAFGPVPNDYISASTGVGNALRVRNVTKSNFFAGVKHRTFGSGMRLGGDDFIITIPAGTFNAGQIMATIPFNPALLLGTRIYQFAPMWSRYRAMKMELEWQGATGTGQAGTAILFIDSDPDDVLSGTDPAFINKAEAHDGKTDVNIWDDKRALLHRLRGEQTYFIQPGGSDARLTTQAIGYMVCKTTFTASSSPGSLSIRYIYDFFVPELTAPAAAGVLGIDSFIGNSVGTSGSGSMFGTNASFLSPNGVNGNAGDWVITGSNNQSFTLPYNSWNSDKYLFAMACSGTGLGAVTITALQGTISQASIGTGSTTIACILDIVTPLTFNSSNLITVAIDCSGWTTISTTPRVFIVPLDSTTSLADQVPKELQHFLRNDHFLHKYHIKSRASHKKYRNVCEMFHPEYRQFPELDYVPPNYENNSEDTLIKKLRDIEDLCTPDDDPHKKHIKFKRRRTIKYSSEDDGSDNDFSVSEVSFEKPMKGSDLLDRREKRLSKDLIPA